MIWVLKKSGILLDKEGAEEHCRLREKHVQRDRNIKQHSLNMTLSSSLLLVHKFCLTLCNIMDCSPPGSCPSDFPGKNPGAWCHFLLQGILSNQGSNHISSICISNSLWSHGLYSPGNSPGQNTGVGSLFLLQGIFPTQGLNPGLLYGRQILYQLSHKGSPPSIGKWVLYH